MARVYGRVLMPEEEMPLWMRMFQKQVLDAIGDLKDELKELVTKDTFRDEKTRVNEAFERQGGEIAKLREDQGKESVARQNAEIAQAEKARLEAEARSRVQTATNWQWILLVGGVVLSYLSRFLPGGG
jgi:hypothetical protein